MVQTSWPMHLKMHVKVLYKMFRIKNLIFSSEVLLKQALRLKVVKVTEKSVPARIQPKSVPKKVFPLYII